MTTTATRAATAYFFLWCFDFVPEPAFVPAGEVITGAGVWIGAVVTGAHGGLYGNDYYAENGYPVLPESAAEASGPSS